MYRRLMYLLAVLLLFTKLHARSWSFLMDNDFYFESDDRYTAGLFLNWMGDVHQADSRSFDSRYAATYSDLISFFSLGDFKQKNRSASLGIQEFIITPDDLEAVDPIYDDAPYIGMLSLNFGLFVWDATSYEEYRTTIGMIGPSTGATEIQTRVHKIIGSQIPQGWQNQLEDTAFLQLSYINGFKNFEHEFSTPMRLQWFNNYALHLGNIYLGGGVGSYLRLGRHMPDNFVAISDGFNSSPNHQINIESRAKESGWAMRVGLFANLSAYSYIGKEALQNGYDYDESHSQIMTQIGCDFFVDNLQFSIEIYPIGSIYRSYREDSWGRVHITWYQ